MEGKSKNELNASSLIDLKAELFRKQEEFNKQKADQGGAAFVKARVTSEKAKPNIWSKQNVGVLKRAQRDLEVKAEEEDLFEKSRKALEAKARLYEKIASSKDIPDEDGSEVYLVDFQKKAIDSIVEKRRRLQEKEEEEEDLKLTADVPPAETPDEEWVDYVDAFGRSRRCLRKDLPELQGQRRQAARPVMEPDGEDMPQLMSGDMRREMQRRKWEQEEEESLSKPVGSVHYANVQHSEIRDHGVGFYQFAKDSDARAEQMNLLHTLREKTVTERTRAERVKEKRKAMMDARLAKVRRRQRLKAGLPEEEPEEDAGPKLDEQWTEKEEGEKTEAEKAVSATKEEPELLKRDDSWRRSAPEREWDIGKPKPAMWSEEKYLNSRREERVSDFAPPSFYSDSVTPEAQSHIGGVRGRGRGAGRGRGRGRNVPSEPVMSGQSGEVDVADLVSSFVHSERMRDAESASSSTSHQTDVSQELGMQRNASSGESGVPSTAHRTDLHDIPPPSSSFPPANTSLPPPNTSFTPPSTSLPLPNTSFPPPNMSLPPPYTSLPLPNTSLPPPGLAPNVPLPRGAVVVTSTPQWPPQPAWCPPGVSAPLPSFPPPPGLLPLPTGDLDHPGAGRMGPPPPPVGSTDEPGPESSPGSESREDQVASNPDSLPDSSTSTASSITGADDSLADLQKTSRQQTSAAGAKTKGKKEASAARSSIVDTRFVQNAENVARYKYALHEDQLPEFLQPNTEVAARPYEFGSFMAAKKAAAVAVEQELAANSHRVQFSGGAIMYGKLVAPADEDGKDEKLLWYQSHPPDQGDAQDTG